MGSIMRKIWLGQAAVNVGAAKKVIGRGLTESELKKVYLATLNGDFDVDKIFPNERSKTLILRKVL